MANYIIFDDKYVEKGSYRQRLNVRIILCPEKKNIEVEYALRTTNKPIGVAAYKLIHKSHGLIFFSKAQ
ncbi:MAG: PDDEXK nuclease domain-containing protein [Chitinophagales bacterium]